MSNPQAADAQLLRRIESASAQLYHDLLGKGPTRARAILHGDVLVVILEDIYTTGEQTLVTAGQVEQLLAGRAHMQRVLRPHCIEMVERLTGRKVRAFLSQNHVDPDIAAEIFLLQERGHGTSGPVGARAPDAPAQP
ncbi:MAG: Na-translocating system protein MpsC family protein [Gaiellales bacterium]